VEKTKLDDLVARYWDGLKTGSSYESRHAGLVARKRTSIANPERQAGQRLTSTEFMRRLRLLNPLLVMDPHPNRHYPLHKDKSIISLLLPDGKKEFLLACEGDYMPEWSVMSTTSVKAPVHKPQGPWAPVRIPYREVKRGWRTVLIRLLQKGLVTLDAVEKEFGSGNRASWAALTGKSRQTLPI